MNNLLNYYNKYNDIKEPMADQNYNKIQNDYILGNKFHFKNVKKDKNPFLFYNRKIFHPNKKRMDKIDNLKPFHELRKEQDIFSKQNFINNALKKFLIIKKEENKKNNLKLEINTNNSKNEYKFSLINNSVDKFYKPYNTLSNFKHNLKFNYDFDNSRDKMKTFYGSKTLKPLTKSNKIKNLKVLSISIDNKKKNKYKLFNNNLLSNHFESFNHDLISIDNKSNRKINSRYEHNEQNLLYSFDENIKNEKELKQISLTIDKKRRTENYSMKLFKKGNIIYNSYKNDNGKIEKIKTSYDTQNQDKYKRTQKFSSFFF